MRGFSLLEVGLLIIFLVFVSFFVVLRVGEMVGRIGMKCFIMFCGILMLVVSFL